MAALGKADLAILDTVLFNLSFLWILVPTRRVHIFVVLLMFLCVFLPFSFFYFYFVTYKHFSLCFIFSLWFF